MNKEWKVIDGYDGFYEVSRSGIVRSWKVRNGRSTEKDSKSRLLKAFTDKDGYRKYGLSKDGLTKQFRACRLVAIAFIPNPESKPQVNHINVDKIDDSLGNLEWATAKENVNHSIYTGLRTNESVLGSKNPMSKLTSNDVLDIINAYNLGCFTHQELADSFDVCRQHVSNIISEQRWAHVQN